MESAETLGKARLGRLGIALDEPDAYEYALIRASHTNSNPANPLIL